TSPTLLWTGKVGDASAFRVWGSRAFVRDLSADKLSPRATPCVFLGFPPDAPGWQFYHPTSRHVLSSQDVTFDESVPYYLGFFAAALDTPGDLRREVRDRGTGCMTCSSRCGRSDVGTRDQPQRVLVVSQHMAAAKRVLRYLCSTSGMGLVLGGRSLVVLTGHADASWADDQTTQRSSQGYTFSLGSGSVSWRSTRSSSVLSSSC
ncbi:unnamed protein product, partial [Closterium sp. NIES-53]